MCVWKGEVKNQIQQKPPKTNNKTLSMQDRKLGNNGIEPWYSNCNLQNPGLPCLTFMSSASKFP